MVYACIHTETHKPTPAVRVPGLLLMEFNRERVKCATVQGKEPTAAFLLSTGWEQNSTGRR